jgi:regulator of sigma E protease
MILTIIIALFSLVALMVFHEFGHFILAKKFGIRVEEFGIGYPPRIFGKKFKGTIYSINLIPFGAFVRILGESEKSKSPDSFSEKPFWQRALVILGGVVSFWLVSAVLLTIVMMLGVPTQIGDDESGNFINPKVQILAVAPRSPAELAGIKIGDTVIKIKNQKSLPAGRQEKIKNIDKVKELQDFISENKGEIVTLTIQRGKDIFDISVIPRISPPADEGPLGVMLVRTALKSYPWYIAPIEGVKTTVSLTKIAASGWIQALIRLVERKPTGVQLMGPVGIFGLFVQTSFLGASYFLQLIAVIAVFVALFNILPIPATDGGKLLFLIIEKIKGKPLNQKLVQNIELAFFSLLIILMIFVTFKDIQRFF